VGKGAPPPCSAPSLARAAYPAALVDRAGKTVEMHAIGAALDAVLPTLQNLGACSICPVLDCFFKSLRKYSEY
jgi:hypothetical protein